MESKFEQLIIFTFYKLKRHGIDSSVEELYKEVKKEMEKVKDSSIPSLNEFKKNVEDLKTKGFF